MPGYEPKFENRESPEQQLVRLLQERGVEDPEARKLLNEWTDEQEAKVNQLADDPDAYRLAQIHLNLNRARLYAAVGTEDFMEAAEDNIYDAKKQAVNEQRNELRERIEREIDDFEKSLEK